RLVKSRPRVGEAGRSLTPTASSSRDCVADDAVSCELVSTPNSLLTGKLTGNFANSGPQQRFSHLISELIQRLAAKFPTQRNREFLQPNREFFRDNREFNRAEQGKR